MSVHLHSLQHTVATVSEFYNKNHVIKMLKVKLKRFSRASRITNANCAQLRATYLELCSKIHEASEIGYC